MNEFLAMVIDMITKALKEHGLLKTCYALMGIFALIALCLLIWQMPEIIRALQGR